MTLGILRETAMSFIPSSSIISETPSKRISHVGIHRSPVSCSPSNHLSSSANNFLLTEEYQNAYETGDYLECNIEAAESFLCHVCTIQQQMWTLEEVEYIKNSLLTLSPLLSRNDWIPSQLNLDFLMNKVIENIKASEIESYGLFEALQLLLGYGGQFCESTILNAYCAILSSPPYRKTDLDILRIIYSRNFVYEEQLFNLFWERSGEVLKETERLSVRNSIALSHSSVLLTFCQVYFEKSPDSMAQFMTRFADRVMDLIVNKCQLELISFLIESFYSNGKNIESLYFCYFFQRLIKLLLAAVVSKFEISSRTIILDKLFGIYSLACPEITNFSMKQFMARFEPTIEFSSNYFALLSSFTNPSMDSGGESRTDQEIEGCLEFKDFFICCVFGSYAPKIPGLLLKILCEDSAILRQKSLKFLYLLYQCKSCSSIFTEESFHAIISKCIYDNSVWVKDVALDILIEELENGISINSQSLEAILNGCINSLRVFLFHLLIGLFNSIEK